MKKKSLDVVEKFVQKVSKLLPQFKITLKILGDTNNQYCLVFMTEGVKQSQEVLKLLDNTFEYVLNSDMSLGGCDEDADYEHLRRVVENEARIKSSNVGNKSTNKQSVSVAIMGKISNNFLFGNKKGLYLLKKQPSWLSKNLKPVLVNDDRNLVTLLSEDQFFKFSM